MRRKSGLRYVSSVEAKRALLYSQQPSIKCICFLSLPGKTSIRRNDASSSPRKICFCYSTYRFRQIANLLATSLCKFFLLEPLWKSSLEAPWVLVVSPVTALMQDQAKMLPRVADVVPVMLLTEEAGDNGSWTRY